MLEDFRQNGLSDTATTILSALKAHGIAGTTSLELGCGVGGLTLRLLREGVTSARGIDLSPKVVDAARSLAAEEGFSGSVTFSILIPDKNQSQILDRAEHTMSQDDFVRFLIAGPVGDLKTKIEKLRK